MRLLLLVVAMVFLLVLIGCNDAIGVEVEGDTNSYLSQISYFYDSEHDVGIWVYGSPGAFGKGIAVLPGSTFENPSAPAKIKIGEEKEVK